MIAIKIKEYENGYSVVGTAANELKISRLFGDAKNLIVFVAAMTGVPVHFEATTKGKGASGVDKVEDKNGKQ